MPEDNGNRAHELAKCRKPFVSQMADDNRKDARKLDGLLKVIMSVIFVNEMVTKQGQLSLSINVPIQFHGQQQSHKSHEQKCRMLQPRMFLEQFDAITRTKRKVIMPMVTPR